MPSPLSSQKPITLHRGINLITVCLLLSTSFLQSLQPDTYWLQGNKLGPGIHTLSGPIDLKQLPQDFTLDCRETGNPVNISDTKLTNTLSKNFTERPQKSTSDSSDVPNLEQSYMTSAVVHCINPKSSLPFNAVLGHIHIRLSTDQDQLEFQEAAQHTSSQLADAWYTFAENSQYIANATVKPVETGAHQTSLMSFLPKWNVPAQISKLKDVVLDSSVLSPFLETNTQKPSNMFAPIVPTPLKRVPTNKKPLFRVQPIVFSTVFYEN